MVGIVALIGLFVASPVAAQRILELTGILRGPESCYSTFSDEAAKPEQGEALIQGLEIQSVLAPAQLADDFSLVMDANRDRHEAQKRLVSALLAICEKLPIPAE